MVERGQHFGLALEARDTVGFGQDRVRKDLDRHFATELQVASVIDLAHAAGAQQRLHLVVAEHWSDHVAQW